MEKTRLMTLGDSWVWGIGCGYDEGQSSKEYQKIYQNRTDADTYSFRGLISEKYNLTNKNLSKGGSSNPSQFRKAIDFLETQDTVDDMIILWGITSLYRFEFFDISKDDFVRVVLSDTHDSMAKIMLKKYFKEEVEVAHLYRQIVMFNAYCKQRSIKNYWFNTFQEQNWPGKIDNLLFDGWSLLSKLVDDYQQNNEPHMSTWTDTDDKIKLAKEKNLVNPWSGHPTKQAHVNIMNMFTNKLNFNTGEIRE